MSEATTVEPGEVKPVLEDPELGQDYQVRVEGSTLRVGHNPRRTRQDGQAIRAGDRVRWFDHQGRDVFGYVPNSQDGPATVEVDAADLGIEFQTRAVIGGVQTSAQNDASPASDDFVFRYGIGVDPSTTVVEDIQAPDRADFLVVSVDDLDDPAELRVRFLDEDGNEITSRGPGNSSGYTGGSSTDILQRVAVASPRIEVELSGAATTADYSIYAR